MDDGTGDVVQLSERVCNAQHMFSEDRSGEHELPPVYDIDLRLTNYPYAQMTSSIIPRKLVEPLTHRFLEDAPCLKISWRGHIREPRKLALGQEVFLGMKPCIQVEHNDTGTFLQPVPKLRISRLN